MATINLNNDTYIKSKKNILNGDENYNIDVEFYKTTNFNNLFNIRRNVSPSTSLITFTELEVTVNDIKILESNDNDNIENLKYASYQEFIINNSTSGSFDRSNQFNVLLGNSKSFASAPVTNTDYSFEYIPFNFKVWYKHIKAFTAIGQTQIYLEGQLVDNILFANNDSITFTDLGNEGIILHYNMIDRFHNSQDWQRPLIGNENYIVNYDKENLRYDISLSPSRNYETLQMEAIITDNLYTDQTFDGIDITSDRNLWFNSELQVSYYKNTAPYNLNLNNKTLTWSGNGEFTLYMNGIELITTSEKSYTLSDIEYYGNNTFSIKNNSKIVDSFNNIRNSVSNGSETINYFSKRTHSIVVYTDSDVVTSSKWNNRLDLPKPNITITQKINEITLNTSLYSIFDQVEYTIDEDIILISNASYKYTPINPGAHTIKARYFSNEINKYSDYSNYYVYLNTLTSPQLSLNYRYNANTYNIDIFDVDDNASQLELYINGKTAILDSNVSNLNITPLNKGVPTIIEATSIYTENEEYNSSTYILDIPSLDTLPAPNNFKIIDGETMLATWDPISLNIGVTYRVGYTYDLDPTEYYLGDIVGSSLEIGPNFQQEQGYGLYKWFVKAIFPEDEEYNSIKSNVVQIERKLLDKPIIDVNLSTVSWTEVENADYYEITLIGTNINESIIVRDSLNRNVYNDLKYKNVNSDVTVGITAHSDTPYKYHYSDRDNIIDAILLRVLNTPTWNEVFYDENQFYFNVDPNASSTTLTTTNSLTNDKDYYLNITSPYYLVLPVGSYRIILQSLRDETITNASTIYFNSLISEVKSAGSYGILTLERDNLQLNWNNLGADKYILYDNNVSIKTFDASINYYIIEDKYRLPGEHVYKLIAYNNFDVTQTSESNTISVSVSKITTPITSWVANTSILNINTQPNLIYQIYVNNILSYTNVTENQLVINYENNDNYTIEVMAEHTIDQCLNYDSDRSIPLIYEVSQIGRINDLVRVYNGNEHLFSWTKPLNADIFDIYYDGVFLTSTTNNTFTLDDEVGSHNLYIISRDSNSLENPNPKHKDSEPSNLVKFGKLNTPVIRIENNILVWEEIINADEYEIYNHTTDNVLAVVTSNNYDFIKTEVYSYDFMVRALNYEEEIEDSDLSNTVEFDILKLEEPNFLNISEDLILSWDNVLNATYYRINADNLPISYSRTNNYSIAEFLKHQSGVISFTINALSDYIDNRYLYLMSDESYMIRYFVQKERMYNIIIDGENYDDIQLPFTINETSTDVLNTALLTLGYISRKEPFQQLEPASIVIYDEDLNLGGKINSRTWDMLIVKDTVTEYNIGENISTYTHELELIQKTALLQNKILPNKSFSQPITTRGNTRSIINSVMPDDRQQLSKNYVTDIRLDSIYNSYNGYHKLLGYSTEFNTQIYNNYNFGEYIKLPFEYNAKIKTKAFTSIFGAEIDPIIDSYYDYGTPSMIYKIRKTNPSNYPTSDEQVIYTLGQNKTPGKIIKISELYGFKKGETYDLILEIPGINIGEWSRKIYPDVSWLEEVFTNEGFPRLEGNDFINFMTEAGNTNPTLSELKPYRMLWKGIYINNDETEMNGITVAEAIQTLCDTLNPVDIDDFKQFQIDPVFLGTKESDLLIPDTTITNGKTFYEELVNIGNLFNGQPRLIEDGTTKVNYITFDINSLSNPWLRNQSNNIAPSTFEDYNSLTQEQLSLDQYASGYISNIENMIPDRNVSTYPSGDLFTTLRSNDEVSATVMIDSASLVVDRPIYKIEKLIMSDINNSFEFDITDYVVENTVSGTYNSIELSRALIYTQGENKITNFGQLARLKEILEAANLESTEYVITKIWEDHKERYYPSVDITKPDVQNMTFKLYYVPYVNSVIYTEKDKENGMKFINYHNLNQSDSVISDSRFGKSAITQIRRLGTSTIQKVYKTKSARELPLLGYNMKNNDEDYFIDNISYTFYNNYIASSVNYSKYYNKIDPIMKINSTYRDYEIPQVDIIDRTININEFFYLSNKYDYESDSSRWVSLLRNAFYGNQENAPSSFYINCYSNINKDRITYSKIEDNNLIVNRKVEGILLNASMLSMSNSILFSGKMADNFSAGSQAVKAPTDDIREARRFQDNVRYVSSELGNQLPYIQLSLVNNIPSRFKFNSYQRSLPSTSWESNPKSTFGDSIIYNKNIIVNKDYREALNFAYQIHFKSEKDNKVFIHSGISNNIFKNILTNQSNGKAIWISYNGDLSAQDYVNNFNKLAEVIANNYEDKVLNVKSEEIIIENNYDGYALIWENTGEIIFDFKEPLVKNETKVLGNIYLNFKKNIK